MERMEKEARLAVEYLDLAVAEVWGDDPEDVLRFILAARLAIERGLEAAEVEA